MPFDWMHASVNPAFAKKIANRFTESALAELEQRARLLHGLRFPKAETTRRLQARVAWEFALSKPPAFGREIPAIVDRVYGRA